MADWAPSPASWSFSAQKRFETCPRSYFYRRFWGHLPGDLKWRCFEMRSLETMAAFRGKAVHSVIAGCLRSASRGEPVDRDQARRRLAGALREGFGQSARGWWSNKQRPSELKIGQVTSLREHYYGWERDEVERAAGEAQRHARSCVDSLLDSDLWRAVSAAPESRWALIEGERPASFYLDGVLVYMKVDFAYWDSAPTIVDWKTGKPGDGDRSQLALYALYAQDQWGWDPLQVRLMPVYLHPTLQSDSFQAKADQLENVRQRVRRSFEEMQRLEPAPGCAADEALFPRTEDLKVCRWCTFQGACDRVSVPSPRASDASAPQGMAASQPPGR
ncbi:MAG TPA: PD-(D/E)XK nuclease family protein [Armatimonadota bacterium]